MILKWLAWSRHRSIYKFWLAAESRNYWCGRIGWGSIFGGLHDLVARLLIVRPWTADYQSRRSSWTGPTGRSGDMWTTSLDRLDDLDGRSGLVVQIVYRADSILGKETIDTLTKLYANPLKLKVSRLFSR